MNAIIEQMQDHLQRHPNDRFAMYTIAFEYKKLGEFERARTAFEALLQAHPESGAGHYQHGLLWAEQGDATAARAAWNEGLERLRGVKAADARRSTSEIQAALDDLDDDAL